MPPEALSRHRAGWAEAVPPTWRTPLVQLALAWIALIALLSGTWGEMVWQWWNDSTVNHVLSIPPILAWLVRLRWPELVRLQPQASWPALGWFAAGLTAWTVGTAGEVNLVAQLGAVMLLQGTVAVVLGPRVSAGLLFPLGFMLFLVPFGDEIVPPLQTITARIAVTLTNLSGVPASLSRVFIDTPVGRFEVAEACSGVKFLVAMIALGALVAHLGFRGIGRRTAFMIACMVVPVLANGVRAWGTIYIAQSQGVAFAAGFDHIVYGWVFFAVVMAVLIGGAWRFFDRPADDRLVDFEAIDGSRRLARLAEHRIGGWSALAAMLVLAAAATWGVAQVRPLVEGLLAVAGARP